MDLNVKLKVFEGPLDLLLHLLEKNKVNIYDIPIVEITRQYLEYIDEMQKQDLNSMSEFLFMAATLIDIKSRMLLPKKEEEVKEEDPREELLQKLLEYKMYKSISYELKDRQVHADRIMYKHGTLPKEVLEYEQPVVLSDLISGLSLSRLNKIFQAVIKKQEAKIDPIRSKFGKIEKEEISLTDKINFLEAYAQEHRSFRLRALLEKSNSKMELIVTFLAVLEMMKTGKIQIAQNGIFDDIWIQSNIAA